MAAEVDICNLALAHLGDAATIASINPPEGSAQAEHCARFYPMARDALLESYAWGFSTRRAVLAKLTDNARSEWDYAYALPADTLQIMAVLPPDSTDDYISAASVSIGASVSYTPQPFACEINEAGAFVIYSDQVDAIVRYTALVTDSTKFSPLFTLALSWQLAAMLAGPVLKGDVGAAEAKRCTVMAQAYLAQARQSDANQRRLPMRATAPWLAAR